MIRLTLFDNTDIVVNADLVEFVEETPDTVVSLTTGKKIVVKESVDQVIDRIVGYKQQIMMGKPRRKHLRVVDGGADPSSERL